MFGLDGDTVDTSARLSRFVMDHDIALPMLNILVPTPGTPMYARLRQEGRHAQDGSQRLVRGDVERAGLVDQVAGGHRLPRTQHRQLQWSDHRTRDHRGADRLTRSAHSTP